MVPDWATRDSSWNPEGTHLALPRTRAVALRVIRAQFDH